MQQLCQYCNNPVPPNVNNCPSCGAPVVNTQYAPPPQQQFQQTPPQQQYQQQYPPQYQQQFQPPVVRKSRAVYIVLGIFFGCLGIHNFYAGRNGVGLAQLLLSLIGGPLTCGILVGAVEIWSLIDIITVNTDGNNVPME